ncbi:MAG: hypothetical protein AAF203_11090, partial [Pseudomonadota bacterium]
PQFGVPITPSGQLIWNTSISYLRTESKGQGGSVELNNGDTTATFFQPSNTVASSLINLETGLNYHFLNQWYVSGDLIFNGLLGDKRTMGLFISVGYSWGQGVLGAASSFGGEEY